MGLLDMELSVNTVVSIALLASVVICAYLIASTITRCRSEKKNFFIICLFAILVYVIGNYFEVTSTNTGEAFAAIKVLYAGGCFIAPFFLMFVLDYCEQHPRPAVTALLTSLAFVNLMFVWTTEDTDLIYRTFVYSGDTPIHGLNVLARGPLYPMFMVIGIVCIIIAIVTIMTRFRNWGAKYRKALIMLSLFSATPIVSNLIYIFTAYNLEPMGYSFNFTALVLVASATIFYYSVLRYDLFDFTSRAKSLTVDFAKDAVIVMDVDMRYSSANDAARSLFPSLENIKKGSPVNAIAEWPLAFEGLGSGAGAFADGDVEEIEFTVENDGESRRYRTNVRPFSADEQRGGEVLGAIMMIRDITKEHRLMRELEEAAYTDELTGLYNRRHFMELAAMTLIRSRRMGTPCCAMIFDLDHFKNVNDTFGHLAGDAVLRSVAKRLKSTARAYDLFARYGGEEFVVLIDGASLADAERLAERIRKQIEASVIRYDDIDIKITCSIGVAQASEADFDINDVLRRADDALYTAKKGGRNMVCSKDA
ncbi:MAG: diguanylate cyclase [Clostridiales Family XIII bacterium]|jgi:diguanylate cyclase (GGDEF)-like protein|nr:diguanylate cyclase [Clostridiales Family XIII bacterium]